MSSPITDELLQSVLSAFPLSGATVTQRLEASKRNDNFLVEDASGRRYVLRRYRRNIDEARIVFQVRFQQEMHRRGLPTSEVIEPASGESLVATEAGPWVLFAHVEGSEFDFSRMGQVAEAGRRLGEFHTMTDAIRLEEVAVEVNPLPRGWWTDGERQLSDLEAVFHDSGVDEEIPFLRQWQARLVREWPLPRFDSLPQGWVHGDYHGRNVVFVGDEMRGLFDLDNVLRGYWIADVAKGLFMFGRESRASRRIRPEAARAFLKEYGRVRALGQEERQALPMMGALIWEPFAPYYLMLRRDGEDPVPYFRNHVSLMRDVQAELERLGDVLGAG